MPLKRNPLKSHDMKMKSIDIVKLALVVKEFRFSKTLSGSNYFVKGLNQLIIPNYIEKSRN